MQGMRIVKVLTTVFARGTEEVKSMLKSFAPAPAMFFTMDT